MTPIRIDARVGLASTGRPTSDAGDGFAAGALSPKWSSQLTRLFSACLDCGAQL